MELKIITKIHDNNKSEEEVIKAEGFTKILVQVGRRVSILINFRLKIQVKTSWFTTQSVETEY